MLREYHYNERSSPANSDEYRRKQLNRGEKWDPNMKNGIQHIITSTPRRAVLGTNTTQAVSTVHQDQPPEDTTTKSKSLGRESPKQLSCPRPNHHFSPIPHHTGPDKGCRRPHYVLLLYTPVALSFHQKPESSPAPYKTKQDSSSCRNFTHNPFLYPPQENTQHTF